MDSVFNDILSDGFETDIVARQNILNYEADKELKKANKKKSTISSMDIVNDLLSGKKGVLDTPLTRGNEYTDDSQFKKYWSWFNVVRALSAHADIVPLLHAINGKGVSNILRHDILFKGIEPRNVGYTKWTPVPVMGNKEIESWARFNGDNLQETHQYMQLLEIHGADKLATMTAHKENFEHLGVVNSGKLKMPKKAKQK